MDSTTKAIKRTSIKMISIAMAFVFILGLFLPAKTNAIYETYQGVTYFEGSWIGPVGQEVDATGWSAARVIYQTSQWYGINPQTLLATLQKESSLVTYGNPPFYLPMWAMGYAYTEGGIVAVCSTSTNHNPTGSCAGFAMQMDWAGGSLKAWQNSANSGAAPYYRTGNTINIDGQNIVIGNGATAALYRYTPHIQAGFHNIFNNWWPTGQTPLNNSLVIDDATFANSGTMSEAQIQAFLVANGSYLASYTVPAGTLTPVYRFYNTNGRHFYTASSAERDNIKARWGNIYKFEGTAYTLTDGANNVPLHRFYNTNGTHFYTASESEKNNIMSRWGYQYKYEGVAYNVSNTGTPVHRFWNKNGTHFYTASEAEKNNIMAKWGYIYKYEGVAFYTQ